MSDMRTSSRLRLKRLLKRIEGQDQRIAGMASNDRYAFEVGDEDSSGAGGVCAGERRRARPGAIGRARDLFGRQATARKMLSDDVSPRRSVVGQVASGPKRSR